MSDQVLQASLAYFTAPLASTLSGAWFLRERLSPLQVLSMAVAAVGVVVLTAAVGHMPWLALAIALTGSFDGLVRKLTPTDGFISLAVETTVMTPFVLAYLGYLAVTGTATGNVPGTLGLLMLAGPVTTVPFLCFGRAIHGLRLSTMGILQYFTPSIQLLAVFLFREPFPAAELVSFACIGTAVVIYTADSLYWAVRQARLESHRTADDRSVTIVGAAVALPPRGLRQRQGGSATATPTSTVQLPPQPRQCNCHPNLSRSRQRDQWITSPPARVNIARSRATSWEFSGHANQRAEPSHIAAVKPPLKNRPSPSAGCFRSKSQSSGLVQMAACSSSTVRIMIVFEVPSRMSLNSIGLSASKTAPFPTGRR